VPTTAVARFFGSANHELLSVVVMVLFCILVLF
jgi:hypothetical protein